MKRKCKREISMFLALTMALSMSACGQNTATPTESAEPAKPQETVAPSQAGGEAPVTNEAFDSRTVCEGVTLTIAVPSDDEVIDWNTTLSTQMVEEALGVNLEFEVYASADYYDKLNIMVNGGDELPDIIMGHEAIAGIASKNYMNWAAAEAIIPLNEYYANPDYAHYTNLASERVGLDLPSLLKDGSGNIWGAVKYYNDPTNEIPSKLCINEEYCKKLGFEVPTTTEEFYELCKAFAAAGDVNGNGIDDEVCLTGRGDDLNWFWMLMSSYAYAWDDYYLDVTDGALNFSFTSDGWKEGLKYIKRFFDDGLIDTTALTQDKTSYQAIVTDKDAGVLADVYYHAQMKNNDAVQQYKTRMQYAYVAGLEGPNGTIEARYRPNLPAVGAVISVDCENPLAAFLVLDYMCKEEVSITNRFGEQGVNWDYWEDVDESKLAEGTTKADYAGMDAAAYPVPTFLPYSDGTYWGVGQPQSAGYMQNGVLIKPADLYWGWASLKNVTGEDAAALDSIFLKEYTEGYLEAAKYIPEETVLTLPLTTEESNQVNTLWSPLKNYIKESIGAFLTGEWDIDSYWDTYMAELEKLDYNELLNILQTSYDRTK